MANDTWIAGDGNWFTSDNWLNGTPDLSQNVVIPLNVTIAGTTIPCSVTALSKSIGTVHAITNVGSLDFENAGPGMVTETVTTYVVNRGSLFFDSMV